MKPSLTFPCSPDDYHKWSDEHRTQVWDMIERVGKGQVSCKEAREILREERKALMAASKQLFGVKASPGSGTRFRSFGNKRPKEAQNPKNDRHPG
jgi:hypothetical protein